MKAIPNYENYLINEDGTKVFNTRFNRYIKICKIVTHHKTRDYICPYVGLSKNGKHKVCLISRLVYATFIGEIPDGMQVDHIDNDPENNSYSNLQLLSPSENVKKCFTDDPTLRKRLSESRKKCFTNDPTLRKRLSEAKKKHYHDDPTLRKRLSEAAKGKVWVNNGVITKLVFPTEIPEGFVRGRMLKKALNE